MKRVMGFAAFLLGSSTMLACQISQADERPMIIVPIQSSAETTSYAQELVARARTLLTGQGRGAANAVKLLEEAVRAGEPDAMLLLAEALRRGIGANSDPERAERLLKDAIEAGRVKEGWR